MASLNRCCFIGNAGRDIEVRYTSSGMAIANVSIACSFKTKDEERTEWVNLVFIDKLAEIAGEYITKGKQVYVEGRLQTRKWQDKDGNDRYTTEVVVNNMQLLGGRDGDRDGGDDRGDRGNGQRSSGDRSSGGRGDDDRRGGNGQGRGASQQRGNQGNSQGSNRPKPKQGGFDDMDSDIPF